MSGSVGTNSGRGSGTIGTASAGADTSLSNLASAGERKVVAAWGYFNGSGTVAFYDSLNMSSLTDLGTGEYSLQFSITMANINYAQYGGTNACRLSLCHDHNGVHIAPTTTATTFCTLEYNTAAMDAVRVCLCIVGEVA